MKSWAETGKKVIYSWNIPKPTSTRTKHTITESTKLITWFLVKELVKEAIDKKAPAISHEKKYPEKIGPKSGEPK